MACSGDLPPAKRRRLTATAPFESVPVEVEIEILQSLRSLPSLVRAACTCRRWRQLASDPDFRRRFRATHPPLVLGLFFSPTRDWIPAIPSFVPVRRDDEDLAKVILKGDFLLTPLYVSPRFPPPRWFVADSRCGRLLLFDWHTLRLALINPLHKRLEGFFNLKELDIEDDAGPQDQFLEPRLMCFEEYPSRFWIFFLRHDHTRVQIGMFSHNMRQGRLLPWLNAPGRPYPDADDERIDWLQDGMIAGLSVYWFYRNHPRAIILDMTQGLRCIAEVIPPIVHQAGAEYYVLGEDVVAAEDPHPCPPHIVYALQNRVHHLTGGAPGTLSEAWVRGAVHDLGPDIESLFVDQGMVLPEGGNQVVISDLIDGLIYFTTSHLGQDNATWFCSLYLKTGQVERLLWWSYDARFQPYTMPWPRILLGDQHDDENDDGVEGPSDNSKGNTDREQDGPASSQKMEDLASGPTSEKQLPEQPSLSQGSIKDVLKRKAGKERPSDGSKENTDREQDGPSSTWQMKNLAFGPINEKQLTEQRISSQCSAAGPDEDVLKLKAPWKGTCKMKALLSEKICAEIFHGTLKILLDHHTNRMQVAGSLPDA